jgi:hypothetical protein
MVISWKQTFNANWKLKGKTGTAKYDVTVEIEGPTRAFMTDAAPIIGDIAALEGKNLSEICGRSSLEAVVIYIQKLIEPKLEGGDKLKRLFVWENDMFGAEIS